jgi:AraC-like DNA-binding protein
LNRLGRIEHATMPEAPRANVHVIGPGCRERFLDIEHPSAQALRDLGIVLAGISDLVRPYEMGRPDPWFHVALYTVSGSGWIDVPGCPPQLGAGDLLMVPAATAHGYGIRGASWRVVWFHFALATGLGQSLRGRAPAVRPAAHLPRVEAAVEGFLAEARGDGDGARRAAALQADLIACYLERELARDVDPRAADQRRRLQALWDEVDRTLRHPWSVAALASHLKESQITLYRLCARHFATKPMAMVTRMRMERARQLLRETDESLRQIADRVGYRNEFAFSTAFKRFTSMSPRDFRRQARKREVPDS